MFFQKHLILSLDDQIDFICKENWYLTKEGVICSESNEIIEGTNQVNPSINSQCIKTNNSDCIACADGYYLHDGECKQITNNNCAQQIYDFCYNATTKCEERKEKDDLLQYCLQCKDIQIEDEKVQLYKFNY